MIRLIILLMTSLALSQACYAGGGSQNNLPVQFALEDIAAFSKNVERTLASKRALVAIVSRNGRPPGQLPKGVRFTHVGFAVYSDITLSDGTIQRGYAFHNLYQSAAQPDKSELVVDYALDFFSGASELKAGIIIPRLELQQKLYNVILSDQYAKLHHANYSAIANPFDTRYQNCTEFVMNVTQSALYDGDSIEQIKATLGKWFDPYVIPYGTIELKIAAMTNSDISTDDQKYPYVTATFTSIADYMEKFNLASEILEISDPDANPLQIQRQEIINVIAERAR